MQRFIDWCNTSRWAELKFLPLIFLLCALPTGLGVVLLTPIGEVPDEPQHISRADGLLSGQILGINWHGSATAGVMMNAALFVATVTEAESPLDQPLPEAARRQAASVRWNDRRFGVARLYCTSQMVRYFPAFYAPGALGIGVGQALGIRPLYSLFLGRGFMLLSFLSMGAAALHFARFGRLLLFTVLTLPMTLYLAGSFNLDGQIIGAAALAAALLTRRNPGPNPAWLLALCLLTTVGCAKAPYAWLLLACLPPFYARGFRRRLGLVAAAAAMPAIWLAAARRSSAWPWPRLPYHPGPLWPGSRAVTLTATDVRGNIEVLLAHPAQIVLLPMRALIIQEPAIWQQMIGSIGWSRRLPRIGFLGPALPHWQYMGWLLAGAVSALAVMLKEAAQEESAQARCFWLALLLATVLSIALSAYVTYTSLGATEIDGLQGRYFLPVLPFLLFALPVARRWRDLPVVKDLAAVPTALFCVPAILMAVLDVYALPAQIFHMFRMAGP
jgi:uncharacterized membrane protein